MTAIGYARVSTTDQDLALQVESQGRWLHHRALREGEWRRARRAGRSLTRSLSSSAPVTNWWSRGFIGWRGPSVTFRTSCGGSGTGATLKALQQPIDTSTAAGKCFLDMLGVFAEFETNLRRERQLEGIAKARPRAL